MKGRVLLAGCLSAERVDCPISEWRDVSKGSRMFHMDHAALGWIECPLIWCKPSRSKSQSWVTKAAVPSRWNLLPLSLRGNFGSEAATWRSCSSKVTLNIYCCSVLYLEQLTIMRLISTSLYALSLLGLASASNVIDLDTKNFENVGPPPNFTADELSWGRS